MTVNLEYFNGSSLTAAANIEVVPLIFNQSDDIEFNSPTTIPTTGTHYSWHKCLGLYVSVPEVATATDLSITLSAPMPTGLALFAAPIPAGSYVESGVVTVPDNVGVDTTISGPAPLILGVQSTMLTTSGFVYDTGTYSLNAAPALAGALCVIVLAVGASFTASDGRVELPNLILNYS